MPSEADFTPIVVRVPMDHMQALWFHCGTVRYAFRRFRFFKSLRARFVPVRFRRPRYGTVHPSIGGCTRTTPVPPGPYRRPQRRFGKLSRAGRLAAPATRSGPGAVAAGACQ
jgi:hypothetical protein